VKEVEPFHVGDLVAALDRVVVQEDPAQAEDLRRAAQAAADLLRPVRDRPHEPLAGGKEGHRLVDLAELPALEDDGLGDGVAEHLFD
jgi:hypothetical protein